MAGLPADLVDELKEAFRYFDAQNKNSGALDKRHLDMLMRSIGEELSDAELSGLAPSGTITLDAFLANRADHYLKQQSADEVKQAFSIFDSDGSGVIPRETLKYMLTTMGDKMSAGEVDELLAKAGATSGLKYSEFVDRIHKTMT
eukprot:TRINITY_DN1030_c0_g1_i1.p1 TRINITY_DN1030_c0_g1~~TRINITY_DN1030_c0_g1_i1.p1  ORF type:complete len:155 (-),score=15.88 TRINITY_DN1030_c0_g1_i1:84-518(-)